MGRDESGTLPALKFHGRRAAAGIPERRRCGALRGSASMIVRRCINPVADVGTGRLLSSRWHDPK
jgi:hypothetical protein